MQLPSNSAVTASLYILADVAKQLVLLEPSRYNKKPLIFLRFKIPSIKVLFKYEKFQRRTSDFAIMGCPTGFSHRY